MKDLKPSISSTCPVETVSPETPPANYRAISRVLRTIVVALLLAETLVLANGLLLMQLAAKLSTPVNEAPEEGVRELPRSISVKCTLPTVDSPESAFKANPHKPALPVVGKWEMHAWINDEQITDTAIQVYDHTATVSVPPPIEHNRYTVTIDPGEIAPVGHRRFKTSLPSALSSSIGVQWTEKKASTKLNLRAICKLTLHPSYLDKFRENQYDVSLEKLWSDIADSRPEDNWSHWGKYTTPPNGEPNIQVTVHPEAFRRNSIGLLPEVHLHPNDLHFFPPVEAKLYVENNQTRIPCRVVANGESADCDILYLELSVQLKTPTKPQEPPTLSVLMWPARRTAWPSP